MLNFRINQYFSNYYWTNISITKRGVGRGSKKWNFFKN